MPRTALLITGLLFVSSVAPASAGLDAPEQESAQTQKESEATIAANNRGRALQDQGDAAVKSGDLARALALYRNAREQFEQAAAAARLEQNVQITRENAAGMAHNIALIETAMREPARRQPDAVRCINNWRAASFSEPLVQELAADIAGDCADSSRVEWDRHLSEAAGAMRAWSWDAKMTANLRTLVEMLKREKAHLETERRRSSLSPAVSISSPPLPPPPGQFNPASGAGVAPGEPARPHAIPDATPPETVPNPRNVVVGRVNAVAGTVIVKRGALEIPLERGMAIRFGDTLTSDSKGRLQVGLTDETVFTMGPNAQFILDEFVYDPATARGKFRARTLAGLFRLVTGRIAPKDQDFKLTLPAGHLGRRGTDFTVEVIAVQGGTRVQGFVTDGEIELFDLQGRTTRVTAGNSFDVSMPGPPDTEEGRAIDAALRSGQPWVQGSTHFIPFPESRIGISVDVNHWRETPIPTHPHVIGFLSSDKLMIAGLGVFPDLHLSWEEVEPHFRSDMLSGIENLQLALHERTLVNGLNVTRLRYKATIQGREGLIEAHIYSGTQGVARVLVMRPVGLDHLNQHVERFLAGLKAR